MTETNKIHALAQARKKVVELYGSNLVNFWPIADDAKAVKDLLRRKPLYGDPFSSAMQAPGIIDFGIDTGDGGYASDTVADRDNIEASGIVQIFSVPTKMDVPVGRWKSIAFYFPGSPGSVDVYIAAPDQDPSAVSGGAHVASSTISAPGGGGTATWTLPFDLDAREGQWELYFMNDSGYRVAARSDDPAGLGAWDDWDDVNSQWGSAGTAIEVRFEGTDADNVPEAGVATLGAWVNVDDSPGKGYTVSLADNGNADLAYSETTAGTTRAFYSGTPQAGQKLTMHGAISQVDFLLRRYGSPPGNVYCKIIRASDGVVLATADNSVSAGSIPTNSTWVTFNFNTPVHVDEEVAVVAEYTGGDGFNCLYLYGGGSSAGKPGVFVTGSYPWTEQNDDASMKIWVNQVLAGLYVDASRVPQADFRDKNLNTYSLSAVEQLHPGWNYLVATYNKDSGIWFWVNGREVASLGSVPGASNTLFGDVATKCVGAEMVPGKLTVHQLKRAVISDVFFATGSISGADQWNVFEAYLTAAPLMQSKSV